MTIQTTRWSPDTCQCVLEYEWDDTQSENTRTHSVKTVVQKCTAHGPLSTNTDVWNSLMDENPRKNVGFGLLLDNGPTTIYDVVNGNRQLKNGITVSWTWSGTAPNRVLTLTLTGATLTTAQRNTIQNAMNTRFGTGRVLIG